MPLPPLLQLPDEAAYRQHFIGTYCREAIETHDGIRVFFRQNQFDHAFYESTNRDGAKDAFSWVRAERMNWIDATLTDPAAVRYQGWVARTRSYDPARRVDLLYEDFVVVLALGLNRDGALRANFVTCFQADNSVAKIRTSPLWTREDCLHALR
ncbi:hypothetical protein [Altererythrobacter lauratis]|uniref:Uncharacterized protein n=1 Tax=Alteraurantiacibacter lauratis TaxID=2054627 RepID=A0ABV7EJA5_9SPHN